MTARPVLTFTGHTNLNAFYMRINYLTPRSTHEYAGSTNTIPPDHTGLYRNPLMTSDGYFIAAHTGYKLAETGSAMTAISGLPTVQVS